MIMTDGFASRFPNMLLRIEIGRSRGEEKNLKPGMYGQEGFQDGSLMPFCAVPQEQNWLVGISCQELLQEEHGNNSIHQLGAHDGFLTSEQIECAIKMRE